MRSRIVTARRETTEETTRRRIARGVDVAARRRRARTRGAATPRAVVWRSSSVVDRAGVEDARPRVEDARDDARESVRVRDDDDEDDAGATPARETTNMDSRRQNGLVRARGRPRAFRGRRRRRRRSRRRVGITSHV